MKKIEDQAKLLLASVFPSWSLSLMMKTILDIFTTENNSPNLAHCLLMAFSDLEKQKHKNFLEKQFVTTWSKNLMEPP